ncbi:MAG: hypothetical protein AAF740_07580 [Bacteroidota bacterium]
MGDTLNFLLTTGGDTFDFNSGTVPVGWDGGPGFTVGTVSCLPPNFPTPSLTLDFYFWASTVAAGVTPYIETRALDVSTGGILSFDMHYAIQRGTSPCEGPDLPNEGVMLQYQTPSMGGNWDTLPVPTSINPTGMGYWDPRGGGRTGPPYPWPFTGAWHTLSLPIPAVAQSTATRFRWIQFVTSGPCCDNWDWITSSSQVLL